MRPLFSLLAFLFCATLFAQTKVVAPKKVQCDCDSAITIRVGKVSTYGVTVAPSGPGTKNEVKRNTANPQVFEKEHHSAWYVIIPLMTGDFNFTLIPEFSNDDYDFVIYRYYGTSTCDSVASGKAKPVRSNIARSQNVDGGQTGVSAAGKTEFAGEGPGKAFSKTLAVKKGEKYLLVVDNVYDHGGGHTLKFSILRNVTINGQVTDENGKHLQADVTLYDDSGTVIAETQTDTAGKYKLNASVVELQNYSLVTSSDSTFPDVHVFNTKDINPQTGNLPTLVSILPQLKTGKKYKFSTINFVGNEAIPLPESSGALRALYYMMKKNPTLKIRIEGHVNSVGAERDPAWFQRLSEQRAKYVYDYLVQRGIDASRLSWVGYGDRFMLYPHAGTNEQLKLNRRVEISVVEF